MRTFFRGLLPMLVGVAFLVFSPPKLAIAQSSVCSGRSGSAALQCVQNNYSPSGTLGYSTARDTLFRHIDSNDSGELEGIYSGYVITLSPGEDPTKDAYSKDVNTEHVFPQSKGTDTEPEKSDMHNLYPARRQVNNARSNIAFGESPDSQTDAWYYRDQTQSSTPESNVDAYSERLGSRVWEPRESREGDVARATFYYYAVYESVADEEFFTDMKKQLLAWHKNDPVTEHEKKRSAAIAARQGNENPFVVDETLAERVFGAEATPTLVFDPDTVAVDETDGTASLTVRYDNPGETAVEVDVAFQEAQSTATAADLDGYSSETVSFPETASDGATRTVSVPVTDDDETEGAEEALFELENVQSSGDVETGSADTAVLTISDDENPLVLNEVLADPASDSHGDANRDGTRSARDDEFLELYNTSTSESIDVSGYEYVDDDIGARHVFPDGTAVQPEESIVVFGGGDPASDIPGVVQTASSGTLGLDNDGDTSTVVNAGGTAILKFEYGGDVENESMTRDPDFTGDFVPHSEASGADGALFSPGQTTDGKPLPVELTSFEGVLSTASEEKVVLSWKTASETENAGFYVQRRQSKAEEWTQIGFRKGAGTTTTPQAYRFVDRNLPYEADRLRYRLKQTDTDGTTTIMQEITIARGGATELELHTPIPNPASGRVTVRYAVPEQVAERSTMRLELYDVLGRRVRTIVTDKSGTVSDRRAVQIQTAGLSSGTYLLKLTAGSQSRTRRLTIVR